MRYRPATLDDNAFGPHNAERLRAAKAAAKTEAGGYAVAAPEPRGKRLPKLKPPPIPRTADAPPSITIVLPLPPAALCPNGDDVHWTVKRRVKIAYKQQCQQLAMIAIRQDQPGELRPISPPGLS